MSSAAVDSTYVVGLFVCSKQEGLYDAGNRKKSNYLF